MFSVEDNQVHTADGNKAIVERMESDICYIRKGAINNTGDGVTIREDGMLLREDDASRPFPDWFSQGKRLGEQLRPSLHGAQ